MTHDKFYPKKIFPWSNIKWKANFSCEKFTAFCWRQHKISSPVAFLCLKTDVLRYFDDLGKLSIDRYNWKSATEKPIWDWIPISSLYRYNDRP